MAQKIHPIDLIAVKSSLHNKRMKMPAFYPDQSARYHQDITL